MSTAPTPPVFVEFGINLNRETALTGGIRRITGRLQPSGVRWYEIVGVLLPPIRPRRLAPNYNQRLPPGSMIGLPTYEIAHLWGPGFGDEAWDGMMYAPRDVNQRWQNHGIESRLREMQRIAAGHGGVIELTAEAESHPPAAWQNRGYELLREAYYEFCAVSQQGNRDWIGRVDITVGPPPTARVVVDVAWAVDW